MKKTELVSEIEQLRRAAEASPWDDAPWLAYADALEDTGEVEKAHEVRLGVQRTRETGLAMAKAVSAYGAPNSLYPLFSNKTMLRAYELFHRLVNNRPDVMVAVLRLTELDDPDDDSAPRFLPNGCTDPRGHTTGEDERYTCVHCGKTSRQIMNELLGRWTR